MFKLLTILLLMFAPLAEATGPTDIQMLLGGYQQGCKEIDSSWTPQYANIKGYWKLNGQTGVNQAVGTSVAATLGNNATVTTASMQYAGARLDQGINFNGSGYLDFGNLSAAKALPVSFAAWVKPTSLPAAGNNYGIIALDTWGTANYNGVNMGLANNAGTLFFQVQYGSSGCCTASQHRKTLVGVTSPAANTWYHVVGVVGSLTSLQLYVDATSEAASITGTGASITWTAGGTGAIGVWPGGVAGNQKFAGIIDEVTVWAASLSSSDVQTLFNAQKNCVKP